MDYLYCDFCDTCLVRACCTEPCYIVDLIEPAVCIPCKKNKTCKEICDHVTFYRLDKKYDMTGFMARHFQETCILYKLCQMTKKERKELWSTHARIVSSNPAALNKNSAQHIKI